MLKLTIDHPQPGQQFKVGQTIAVIGSATISHDNGENVIDSVTVALDDHPPVRAHLPRPPRSTVNFQVDVPVPDAPGQVHTIRVAAADDGTATAEVEVPVYVANDLVHLRSMSITFDTHNEDRDHDTILHVFVKNRGSTTATPDAAGDYVSNLLAFQRCEQDYREGRPGNNPYLGYGESRSEGFSFEEGSSHSFGIPLRSMPILLQDVVLPTVDIHILAHGNDTWTFDYTITFEFDDDRSFSFPSADAGVNGIVLDQDHSTYSGICIENPYNPVTTPVTASESTAYLTEAKLVLFTHDSGIVLSTLIDVQVANRLPGGALQVFASAKGIGLHRVLQGARMEIALPILGDTLNQRDIVLPVVQIDMFPGAQSLGPWIFDYQLVLVFSDERTFKSQTYGVLLLQDAHRRHIGAYQGPPFPVSTPPGKPALNIQSKGPKTQEIPIDYLIARIDEFVNNRTDAPLQKIVLDHTAHFGDTLPETFLRIGSIAAAPPLPGVLSLPGYEEGVEYLDSARSIGRFQKTPGPIISVCFQRLSRSKISVNVVPTAPQPITLYVDLDPDPDQDEVAAGDTAVAHMAVRINLTLDADVERGVIDLLSWVPAGKDDDELVARMMDVKIVLASLRGLIEDRAREKLFEGLTSQDPFDGRTLRDKLNETFTSLLVGGSIDGGSRVRVNRCGIEDGQRLVIDYDSPMQTFEAPEPKAWRDTADFSPGNLANIEHIVVLTMENRSFDTMLGYLSLPPDRGGEGRADIDGLTGGEFNLLGDKPCPSFPFAPYDTIFSPDPPHGYEPVRRAIASGAMSGFVQSFAEERGPAFAPRIMGYHTGVNVPTYDALARDFAICDRWFASHPGPTSCNRYYELTGRLSTDADGFWEFDNSGSVRMSFTPTIFDHLTEGGVSWQYFENSYCYLRLFQKYTFDTQHIVTFDDPAKGFVAAAKSGNLPSVTFIDPHFIELPPGANCDGAPADVKDGQAFVRNVVEAVVSGPKWNKTLLIIVYDEHGGFYDHAPPPVAPWVWDGEPDPPIRTTGVRVPMFLISPWVQGGKAFGSGGSKLVGPYFDHTSILKTIARTFLSGKQPYMGRRYAEARDLSSVVGDTLHIGRFLPFVPHHLFYDATGMRLEVAGAATTPGVGVRQSGPADLVAQRFSIEDAGDGHFHLRTHTGNLYLTVDATFAVTQQRKTGADSQRWSLTPNSDGSRVTIRNAAFPGRTLQPSGSGNGASVVLGDPANAALRSPNPWQVTLADQPERANDLSINTNQSTYTTLGSVSVGWAGLPGNPKDWVTIAPSGAPATTAIMWVYVAGEAAGSAAFSAANLAPGRYVARALVNDSYTIIAESAAFTVTAAVPADVSTDKPTYALGESILVRWAGLLTDRANWVGYAPAGSPDNTVTRWVPANGQAAGSLLFEGPAAPGRYVARAFGNENYTKAGESAVFVVA